MPPTPAAPAGSRSAVTGRRRRRLVLGLCGLGAGLAAVVAAAAAPDPLEAGFRQPPPAARPKTWWHWMNDSVTPAGLTADLEAMARVGLGGAQVFSAALRVGDTRSFIDPPVRYLSPAWLDLVRHTASEAQRLGLDLGFLNTAGCSVSGGPGVTPAQGMQHVVWSELALTGGRRFTGPVPRPAVHYGFMSGRDAAPAPPNFFGPEPANLAADYHDLALLAFPTPAAEADEPVPARLTANVPLPDPAVLLDRRGDTQAALPLPTAGQPVCVDLAFATAVTVRSAVVSCAGNDWYRAGELLCSEDGRAWRLVRPLARITLWDRFAPCTTALPETRARFFRFRFTRAMEWAQRLVLAELRVSPRASLHHWEIQAAYVPALLDPAAPVDVAPAAAIPRDQIIDLTSRLQADGTLDWEAPPGRWTLLRMGYAPMGVQNRSGAMAGTVGLEVDKLDRAAVAQSFAEGPARIIAAAGPLAGPVLNGLLLDSWEVFTQNWTPRFAAEFARRRGYDPRPWLPVMTGRVVADAGRSERFLFDLRRTISELVVANHYGTYAALAHRAGLRLYAEAPGHAGPTVVDAFATKGQVDVPMGEFWLGRPHDSGDAKQAAAAAQLYGRRVVACEAFTSTAADSNWQESPATFKALGDHYFAAGINQFILHTYVHQPWPDRPPGLTLGPYGSHFERTNGWLEVAGPAWIRYLGRCQFLLQHGQPVADVSCFVGEDAPNDLPGPDDPALRALLPAGYDYGGCSAEGLLGRMAVRDRRIVLPDGMSYAVLVLPPRPALSAAVARQLRDLVAAGATVVGPRPVRSPTLSDFPAGDDEVRRIGEEVWGPVDGTTVTTRAFGRGRVMWGAPLSSVLPPPDFNYDRTTGARLDFAHRREGATDLYFVSNQGPGPVNVLATFRVGGRQPEQWDPETGAITPVTAYVARDDRTTLPLHLAPQGSVFVVFRRPAAPEAVVGVERNGRPAALTTLHEPPPGAYVLTTGAGTRLRAAVTGEAATLALTTGWTLRFPDEPGPATPWPTLASWSDSATSSRRYFSGTATYALDFVVPAEFLAGRRRVQLELGRVATFAGATLNGRPLRLLWHEPYAVEVTEGLQPGRNRLEVAVTNLLVNRLIGDQRRPESARRTWSSHQPYTPDSPLQPAGLLGPVRLVSRPMLTLAP